MTKYISFCNHKPFSAFIYCRIPLTPLTAIYQPNIEDNNEKKIHPSDSIHSDTNSGAAGIQFQSIHNDNNPFWSIKPVRRQKRADARIKLWYRR